MDTNDCIKQIHAALVAKAKAQCAVEGNNKLALEISGKVAEYGSAWAASFGNDGKLDDDEERALNAKFNALVDTYLPKKDGILVEKAWNGFSILFVNVFKGVKNYLNEWFKLGLACLAVAVVCGCKTYYENAGVRVRTGNVTAPVEISEPTSSANAKFLFFMDGADVYVAKGYDVTIDYSAGYGGTWLTSASTQTVHVVVKPPQTNDVEAVAK